MAAPDRRSLALVLVAAVVLLSAPSAASGAGAPRRALRGEPAAPAPAARWAAWQRALRPPDLVQGAPAAPRASPPPAPAPAPASEDGVPDLILFDKPADTLAFLRALHGHASAEVRASATGGLGRPRPQAAQARAPPGRRALRNWTSSPRWPPPPCRPRSSPRRPGGPCRPSWRALARRSRRRAPARPAAPARAAGLRPLGAGGRAPGLTRARGAQAVTKLSPALGSLITFHDPEWVKVKGTSVTYHKHLAGVGATGIDVQPCLVRLGTAGAQPVRLRGAERAPRRAALRALRLLARQLARSRAWRPAAGAVVAPTLINLAPTGVSVGATGASVSPTLISIGCAAARAPTRRGARPG